MDITFVALIQKWSSNRIKKQELSMENSSRCWRLIKAFLFLLVVSISYQSYAQDSEGSSEIPTSEEVISNGQTLFENNCKVCHSVHEQVVGPALKNVFERRPVSWIQSFVKNSQKVIQGGDEYAQNLYEKFNQTQMPSFNFSDEEILSIVAYIKQESAKEPATAQAGQQAASGGEAQQGGSQGIASGYVTAILIALIVVLILILVVLGVLISVVTKYIKQKEELAEEDKEIVEQKFSFTKLARSPGFIWIVTFIFTAIVAKSAIDGLYSIGVQQGYAPKQPIAFSHKLHAGQFGIDCNYCHTGVRKSKIASIPSPNICMNCHMNIKKVTGSDQPSPEIAKIYDAIENNKPIEWIRVHNLPDLVYFNHSQHVKVGGLECQTCHGPIEEMEVVRQYAPLTMGWCVNCHRETEVNTKGNGYYTKLVELHKEKSKEPLTVEDIGGLECARCHY